MSPGIVEFLLARLAELEETAREKSDDHFYVMPDAAVEVTDVGPGWVLAARPDFVLADCASKRGIVAEHEPAPADFGPGEGCVICNVGFYSWGMQQDGGFPCHTLRLLALPFANHPAYREEWRP